MTADIPPKSRAHWSDPFVIAGAAAGLYALCSPLPLTTTELALIVCGVVVVLLCVLEFLRAPWHATARPDIPLRAVLRRAGIGWIGTMLGLALVLFCWWLL